jgi:LytS/YehU family sensor histidine kinase
MLEYYLKLEQLRNNMKFDYSITIQERLKEESYDIKISPMLLQPFVENAILHGLGTLTKKGMIRLEFGMEKDKEELIISIEDNGIGRQKAMEIKNAEKETHESLATKITEERIAGFEKKYKKNITATIIDLYDENNLSAGTKAIIHFPIIDV